MLIVKVLNMALKKLKLGVMQGRLLPKYQGRYQAHPLNYWQEEFSLAANLGLNCIEFILDYNDFEKNPLFYSGGVKEIQTICKQSQVSVFSICADYFMQNPFTQKDTARVRENEQVLKHLIEIAPELGVTNIVIPCVDASSLKSAQAAHIFCDKISNYLELAKQNNVHLALETDLPPCEFKVLLENLNSSCVTVNYDIGNSASLDFDIESELNSYGHRITDIHIKDRILNGGSVVLGNGNAKFELFFSLLKQYKYADLFIMQVYRDDEGLSIFKQQLAWIMPFLEEYEKAILS